MRRALLVTIGYLVVCTPALASGSPAGGEKLFKTDCASCHTIGGGGTVAPDLKGVVGRSGEDFVRKFIGDPTKMIASGDPTATALVNRYHGLKMPNFGLSAAQVDDLVAYLQGAAPAAAGGSSSAPAPAGNAGAGKALFTGSTAFAHGGPACMSCHSIAGAGTFGGGTVGPDLTKAYAKYGGTKGLVSVLANIPFPRMIPVYSGHTLTAAEQANLAAFMQSASAKQAPSDATWPLVGVGFGVMLVWVALAFVVWPRRRRLVVRRRLVPRRGL